jgi:PAS domain S-box-containing protein
LNPGHFRLTDRRRYNKLIGALCATALAVLSLLGYLVWSGYRQAIQNGEIATRNYAAIIEARLGATLSRADAGLQNLMRAIPLAALSKDAVPRYARSLETELNFHTSGFPELTAFRITDAGGEVIYTSDSPPAARVQLAERDYFRKLRDNPQVNVVFSGMIISVFDKKQRIIAARAIRDAQGVFRGMVFAAIELSYFQKLFQSLEIGAGSNVAIYRSDDFRRVLRWPSGDGERDTPLPPDSPTRTALVSGNKTATITISSAVDNVVRIYSYHVLDSYPFFVSVGVARDDVLADWRRRSRLVGLSGLLLAGLLAALLYRLMRTEDFLKASEERYRGLTELSSDWYWEQDSELRFTSTSGQRSGRGGITGEDHLGRRRWELPGTEIIGQSWEEHQAVLAEHKPFRDLMLRRTAADGKIHFISVAGEPVFDKAGTFTGYRGVARDVTDRVVAEDAVKAKEELMRSTFEQAAVGIAQSAPDTFKILMVNAKFCELLGYTREELIGTDYRNYMHPDETEARAAERAQIVAGNIKTSNSEWRVIRKDRAVFWVNRSLSLVRDAGGEPNFFISVIEDISGRKQAEDALRESERRFSDMLGNADLVSVMLDREARITYCNEFFLRLTGWQREEVLFHNWFDLFIPPGADEVKSVFAGVLDNLSASWHHDNEILTRSGTRRMIRWNNSVLRSVTGESIGTASLGQDITERKQVEAERAILAAIVENSNDAIFSRMLDGTMLSWNAGAERMLGYTAAEAIGKNSDFLIPPTRSSNRAKISEKLLRGELVSNETDRITKDGRVLKVVTSHSPIRDDSGNIIGNSTIVQDITERKQAEAARAALEAQLRESQKMEAIGTLAGGIAHDFNNAIAAILGNAELARQDAANNPPVLESLDEIRKAGRHARDVVQQILSFSRRQPTQRKLLALAPIIEQSARLLRATLPAQVAIDVRCEADLPPVLADVTQIEQAVINLATNARHAMHGKPGRIGLHLDSVMLDAALTVAHPSLRAIYARRPGRIVRLTVSDDGSGMDAATLDKIFEPFFTTKPVGEGTGLGLSVVHGIVQSHEGVIEVSSEPGKGSIFTIYLPVAQAQIGALASDAGVLAPAQPAPVGGQRILYLDDDESLVSLVTRLLERDGYRIDGYTDQNVALAALRADPTAFDLVVTDYNMPGMSGLDVAREVNLLRADLPVAVVSGYVNDELQVQAATAGVREVILKANAVDDLSAVIARLARKVGEKSKPS